MGWNWSSGTAGTGALSRGHSGQPSAPISTLAADADDNNACAGTGKSCDGSTWHAERRTFRLASGDVIWDMAGNVADWGDDDTGGLGMSPVIDANWYEASALSATNRAIVGPANAAWGDAQNIGRVYGGNAGTFRRGGRWDAGGWGGVFSGDMRLTSAETPDDTGFRCVYAP